LLLPSSCSGSDSRLSLLLWLLCISDTERGFQASTFVSTPTLFTDVSTPDSTGPGTSYTTRTISTSAQSDSGTGGSGVGLGQADRIALGVGLSVPLAALLVTIYTCVRRQEP
jgi:hypothetical protein